MVMNSNLIPRPFYLDRILKFKDLDVMKILSGIRRCGKSSLLKLIADKFIADGRCDASQVHLHSFDELPFKDMTDKDLYAMLKAEISPAGRNCFFLDEIQSVGNWEQAVNSLMNEYNADIYVTGSNSRMLSSELSTFLTGRYVSFEIQTLSFEEYLRFRKAASDLPDRHTAFHEYLRYGGFPIVWKNPQLDSETREILVEGIFDSVVYRDVVERYKLRNAQMLERVIGYLADNVGNTFSGKSISDFMKSEKRRLDVETVYSYLDKLEKFFIIGKCPRYDIHGKQLLKTQEKIYFADTALRFVRNAYSPDALASTLENAVYLELRRRGYRVCTGKIGTGEIDFIAEKQRNRLYIQIAQEISSKETAARETERLLAIPDNYPKFLLLGHEQAEGNFEGIKILSVEDFLLNKDY